jgi:hypothetical protein
MTDKKETAQRADGIEKQYEEGKITLNEMRIAMGLKPVDDPGFDQLVKKA